MPDKEITKEIRCDTSNYFYFMLIAMIGYHINEIYLKLVVYLNPKIPKYGKFLMATQMVMSAGLVMISSVFLMHLSQFNEMLINISALMIINEFDNVMGKIFLMHLKSFHLEITLSESFLIFDKVEPWHYQ